MKYRPFQKLQEKLPTPNDDWLRFKPLSQSKSQTYHVTGVNAGKHTYREWRLRQFFPPVKGVTSQYLLRNLRQYSPSLMILVSYWFILASVALIFSNKLLIKYLTIVFKDGKQIKNRSRFPLSKKFLFTRIGHLEHFSNECGETKPQWSQLAINNNNSNL